MNQAFLKFWKTLAAIQWTPLIIIASVSAAPVPGQAADLLVFRDGKQMEGVVSNETLRLRTAYGAIVLNTRTLAEVRLGESGIGLHKVISHSGDRLTGLIEDEAIRFTSKDSGDIKVRPERLTRIALGEGSAGTKSAPLSVRRWIELRTGDRLSGDFSAGTLGLSTATGPIRVDTKEVVSVAFSRLDPALATVSLRNAGAVEGRFDQEELEFKLTLGPRQAIHHQLISKIGPLENPLDPTKQSAAPLFGKDFAGFIWVASGEFVMGSPVEEFGRDPDEGPQTRIVVTNGFWISKCEVTQIQFQEVAGTNPSHAIGDPNRPVEKVTWHEAMEYCRKLTEAETSRGRLPDGYVYRLPTEAEWEYACRAGTVTRFSYGDDRSETQLVDYAWFARNGESMTHPVGTKAANAWGLHDMHGNVWEWCLDRWEGKLPGGTVTNSPVPATGNLRTARGGSWLYEPKACRSANRDDYGPGNRCSDVGFRPVLALP